MGDEDESQWTLEQSRRNQTPQDSWEVCCNWSQCGIDLHFECSQYFNWTIRRTHIQYLIAKDESVKLYARSEVAH